MNEALFGYVEFLIIIYSLCVQGQYSSSHFYNRYRPPGEDQPDGVLRKDIKLWGSEMSEEENIPTFQFNKILNDERELYNWLVTLATQTGIARLQDTPKERGQLQVLGERVGYLAQTSYGLVKF